MDENVHKDHRSRMREQFRDHGPCVFNDIQLMEFLLFYAIPRGDVNPIAHRLLERFGSVSGVLKASPVQLKDVPGIGDNAASLLSLCGHFVRKCGEEQLPVGLQLTTPEEFGKFFLPRFWNEQNEVMMLMSLNHRHEVLNCSVITKGSVSATEINTRLVLQQTLTDNATAAVIAHNHPSGHALPSRADIESTVTLAKMLDAVSVKLLDHIVIADNDFISMRETPTLAHIFAKSDT